MPEEEMSFEEVRQYVKESLRYRGIQKQQPNRTFVLVDQDLFYRCTECGGFMDRVSDTRFECNNCKCWDEVVFT